MSIADIPQLQHLTTGEKLEIIGELWDSIDDLPVEHLISEDEKRILDERLAEHEANPETAIPLEEFRRRWAGHHPAWASRDGF